ncbi:MAG TPA: hypothetical protein VGG25_21095 [Streptosporangiaceae bacterium]
MGYVGQAGESAGVLPEASSGALVSPDPFVLRVLLSGLVLSAVGFFLPWYYVSYKPPHGSFRLHGQVFTAFSYTYSGVSSEHGGVLQFSLGKYAFGEQVLSGAAMTGVIRGALIAVFICTLLSIPALAGMTSAAVWLLRLKVIRFPVDIAHTVAVVIESMGAASFLLLAIGLGSFGMRPMVAQALGNTHAAVHAASYLSVSLGGGFWLVLIGLLVIVGAIAKRFFITLAVLIVGVIALSYVHAPLIPSFVHHLGF